MLFLIIFYFFVIVQKKSSFIKPKNIFIIIYRSKT